MPGALGAPGPRQPRSIDGHRCCCEAGLPPPASRDLLFKRLSTTLTDDEDAPVGQSPRDRGADPRVTGELGISVPHRPLECVRQLVATSPELQINQLIAPTATQS